MPRICFSNYGEMFLVDLETVLYFEADDHYCNVYCDKGIHFMMPFSLGKVESDILTVGKNSPEVQFFRLGRKYLINTNKVYHVNVVRQCVTLKDGAGVNSTLSLPKSVLRNLVEKMREMYDTDG